MAAHSGKKITTDGLVFHFDMENTTKSFRGKPTTNVMSGNVARKNAAENPLNVGTHASIARTTEIVYYSAKRPNVLKYYSTNNTGYAMLNNQFSIENQSGTVYSYSFDYLILRGSTANPFAPTIYGNGYKNPTGGNTGTNISTVDTLLDDGWTRRTTTYTAGHTGYNYLRVNLSTTGTNTIITNNNGEGDFEILFDNFQMEEGVPSPFTEGTRSNTDAIKDLSGLNKTITPINLTYDSDNTFEFDGTDDYLTLSSSIDIYQKSFTIEAWIKRNVSNVEHGIFGDLQYHWFRFHITSANKASLWFGYYNENNIALRNEIYSTGTVGTDWTHVAVTFENGVGQKIYLNGELSATNTNGNAFGLTGGSRGPRYIGRADTSSFGSSPNFFNGEISNLKGYSDKVLTPSEIRKNFIATKDRFGL